MVKTIICDMCKKPLKKKQIYFLELIKVTAGFENYPNAYDSDILHHLDLCRKCFLDLEKEIKRRQKFKFSNQK